MRYYFAPDASAASRYLWYLYYVPMIIAPVLGIWASVQIGKPDDEKIQKGWLALIWCYTLPVVGLVIALLKCSVAYSKRRTPVPVIMF